jgi:cytochrome o ubiquinol oxidase subunit 2
VNKKYKRAFKAAVVLWALALVIWYVHGKNFVILNPAGVIAAKQRDLLMLTAMLSLIVIIPVYIMLFLFLHRYRETNPRAKKTYAPELNGNTKLELVWWGIPSAIILTLSVITWVTSHTLDPHRALAASVPTMKIQVVSLDWKWLFIYPDENIASVNEVEFPVGTPVEFDITSDAPMNSFWIPQLGGQIYAMSGMSTKLNLRADRAGTYEGSSANISGAGFSGMRFNAIAAKQTDYKQLLKFVRSSPSTLTQKTYDSLAEPSENVPVTHYSGVTHDLYQGVLLKYMAPGGGESF